jgi:hypothetical protein
MNGEGTIAHLCNPHSLNGIGKTRPCMRSLWCGKCQRPVLARPVVCGECSYCVRLAERRGKRRGGTYAHV